jgi:hypothetical protein
MRTKDQSNYAINRRPENRRIYAEQQVSWFYAALLKSLHRMATSKDAAERLFHLSRAVRQEDDLAEAHAKLDALTTNK